MSDNFPLPLRCTFFEKARIGTAALALCDSANTGKLGEWTTALTATLVETCRELGLRSSAKGHKSDLLPVTRSEYLGLDLMAFPPGKARWLFPAVVMELENSPREDQIAYSFWKVLCVRAEMRIVFCYRKQTTGIPALVQHLRNEVVEAMDLHGRIHMDGRTFVVVGSRNDADTFPYGFFSWWELETGTGRFIKL